MGPRGRATGGEDSVAFPLTWWRFDRYEIVGDLIRPAPGAKFEQYDAMEAYWSWHERKKSHQLESPPYRGLIDMLSEISWKVEEGEQKLSAGSRKRILDWVNEHGLLGQLQQETLAVMQEFTEEGAAEGQPLRYKPVWRPREGEVGSRGGNVLMGDGQGQGHFTSWRPGRRWAVVLRPADGWGSWRPLAEAWAPYFPDLTEDADGFPLPSEKYPEAFWRAYAEPIDSLVGSGWLLEQVLEGVSTIQARAKGKNPPEEEEEDPRDLQDEKDALKLRDVRGGGEYLPETKDEDEIPSPLCDSDRSTAQSPPKVTYRPRPNEHLLGLQEEEDVLQPLNQLLSTSTPVLAPGPHWGTIERRTYCPSLLAMLALQIMWDLTGSNARAVICDNCGAVFVSLFYNPRFHNERCKRDFLGRERRRKDAEKRAEKKAAGAQKKA